MGDILQENKAFMFYQEPKNIPEVLLGLDFCRIFLHAIFN